MEINLIGLRATAIEDKLQPNVDKCIYNFINAGIRVWVLTGDKLETAINIGYQTKLISINSQLIILNQTDINQIYELFSLADNSINEGNKIALII